MKYWPDIEQQQTFSAADGSALFTVHCDLQQQLAPDVVVRVFAVYPGVQLSATPHKVTHIHYEGWADHGSLIILVCHLFIAVSK